MIRIILTSAILAFGSTGLAMAGCATHSAQDMSCAEGTSWDSASQSCIPLTSS